MNRSTQHNQVYSFLLRVWEQDYKTVWQDHSRDVVRPQFSVIQQCNVVGMFLMYIVQSDSCGHTGVHAQGCTTVSSRGRKTSV